MKIIRTSGLIMLFIFVCLLNSENSMPMTENHRIYSISNESSHKKVVLVIIDSMMGSTVDRAMERNSDSVIKYLVDHGQYAKDLVAPFPTMSVVIESTILTGEMPDQHRIPGLSWYHEQEDRLVDYGTSLLTWLQTGIKQGSHDALYDLNASHLSPEVSTVFEQLESSHLTSGSVNSLMYRGNYIHELYVPFYLRLFGFPDKYEIPAPQIFSLGTFAKPPIHKRLRTPHGIFHSLGLTDQYSAEAAAALVKEGKQPDFLMIFMPDNDKIIHEHGPHYQKGFEKAEVHLKKILDAYGSWERALNENIFIIIGDHGQDKMKGEKSEISIHLNKIFSDYDIAPFHGRISNGQIGYAVNQRMAYVFDMHNQGLLHELADKAMLEEKIALAVWKEGEWIVARHPESEGTFRYKQGGQWKDKYDQWWSWEGDPSIVDLKLNPQNKRIQYQDYPDALNQLRSALDTHQSQTLILVAKPGHSFRGHGSPVHPDGGEHGGLHKNDVLAAMIITGTNQKLKTHRMVDLKKYILKLLIESPDEVTK